MPVETGDDVDNLVDDFSHKPQKLDDKTTIRDDVVDDHIAYPQMDEDKPTVGEYKTSLPLTTLCWSSLQVLILLGFFFPQANKF